MPDPAETDPPLIFDWSKPKRPTARLLLWLVVTSLGLAGFFILFRVVYQTPRHFIPATNHVTLLSPTDPAARALLQRVADRDFFVFSNNSEGKPSPSLEDLGPVFNPTFKNHELKLQDLPQRDAKPPPVRLLDVASPMLPPPDLHDMHALPAPAEPKSVSPFKLTLHFEGALANRKIVSLPDLSTLPPSLDYSAWRFQVGVDADGRVTFALPLVSAEKLTDSSAVLDLLQKVRFAGHSNIPSPVWGIASFEWSQSTEP